jgi:NodT family efflux transporter outer membrane factor (OMF) lipoprotein
MRTRDRIRARAAPGAARSRPASRVAACIVMAVLSGCATGPDYQGPPAIDLGTRPVSVESATAASLVLDRWWEQLGDPVLERLVVRALERNLDLRQAVLRIDEARAWLAAVDSRRWPTVDATAAATARRQSENDIIPILKGRDQAIYSAGLAAAWEPDLFGRVRRSVESAQAQADAVESDADAVRLSVTSEVARTYFSLRAAQQETQARTTSIAALEQVLALTRERVRAGDLPASDLDFVLLRLQSAQAGVPQLRSRAHSAALALGTLTGGLPEDELGVESTSPVAVSWPELPVGQRVDLLERRADIRAAERRLAASTANTGLAMAERFPRLTITASGGFLALDVANLISASSQTLALTPLITWRVFDGGRVQAEIRASEARQAGAAVAYERAVRGALSEVEQSLSDYLHAKQSLAAQEAATRRADRVFELSVLRYRSGDVSQMDVLDAERQRAELLEAQARAESGVAAALAQALKALGGGWRVATSPSKPPAASSGTLASVN